jgi:hypothetical protein
MAAAAVTNIGKKAGLYSDALTSKVANAVNTATEKVAATAATVAETARDTASSLISTPLSGFQSGVQIFFFLTAAALFLFLFLIGIHYTVTPVFSFMPGDDGVIPLSSGGPKQVAFLNRTATPTETAGFSDLYGVNTAFAFDLFVTSEFASNIPRVLFYKSVAPITMADGDTEATLPTKFADSSVVLYMDSLKNDLMVMINTKNTSTNTTSFKKEVAIKNVPIRKPVRIGIVVFKKFVEVYQDGTLVRTITGDSDLLNDESTDKNIFGPTAVASRSVKVSRITYWPYVISPKMFRMDAADKADPAWFV